MEMSVKENFNDTALSHLKAWNKISEDLSDMSCFLLNWVL
jgi:hypothetical protein